MRGKDVETPRFEVDSGKEMKYLVSSLMIHFYGRRTEQTSGLQGLCAELSEVLEKQI